MTTGSGSGSSHPKRNTPTPTNSNEDGMTEVRRGPWTLEEDNLLIHYISCHGEGRWNSLAKSSGLNRTGKSCRLRWLNYLKPDIKRGNLTPQEQLLILELHSKWGNRWSKIAQHLPGRTDNEIKNYWRTRVQKQARQLKVDSNSDKFVEAIRMYWMPRLVEKMEQTSTSMTDPHPAAPPIPANAEKKRGGGNEDEEEEVECYHPSGSGSGSGSGYGEVEGMMRDEYWEMLGDIDWFGEDIGTTFWNTDELWQFR